MDDKEIVKGLKARSEIHFDAFYTKYKNLMFFVIDSILNSEEDSKDILQETLLDVYNNISKFEMKGSFKAWVLKIAKNNAISFYRKQKKIVISEEAILESTYENQDSVLYLDLKRILNMDEFNVLMLHVVYGMKHKDIASYLDKPLGTVTWLYSEAIKKAKKELR